MILYFLTAGRLPYDNVDDIDALRGTICALRNVQLPTKITKRLPKPFQDALKAMLQIDPQFRPTTSQLLAMLQEGKLIVPTGKPRAELKGLPAPPQPAKIDENTRITLALFIVRNTLKFNSSRILF